MSKAMTLTGSRYGAAKTMVRFVFILAAVVIAQGVLNRYFPLIRYFDLPLVFTIYYGFTLPNPLKMITIKSVLELLQDSLSKTALKTNEFSKTLIGFLTVSTKTRFDVDQPITHILALLLFTLLDATVKLALETVSQPVGFSIGRISPMEWILTMSFNILFEMILFTYQKRSHNTAA